MKTAICEMFGIDYPIVAFTHCRDVLIEVSRAGGLGVLGTARKTPEQLETDLCKIDEALQGTVPYGVDIIFPLSDTKRAPVPLEELATQIPDRHKAFVAGLVERFGIPPVSAAGLELAGMKRGLTTTYRSAYEQAEIALRHPIKTLAAALGPAPPDIVERLHAQGGFIGGLVGSADNARRHVAAGADYVIAEGTEAGGHTGEIATMVLTPEVVDAVAPVPVLAAGGIGSGRQLAAALALGAAGAWCGSIWLTTQESDEPPELKEKLLRARSRDTVRSRSQSGKPVRVLRTPWVEAWEAPDSPGTLPMPLQGALVHEPLSSIIEHRMPELLGGAVGQIVGRMNQIRPVREVFLEMVEELIEATLRVHDAVTAE